ncbi:nucleotide-binding universal stress UspA family protein [Chitinophaga dinghuensis]|uniref:Nucleotide-binding universal stress UspA family protein n=1 Tax=Chitinophaga dinghuensis TaxID=1539050 RepID=A0A327VS57_9BACT|nr:universal stress protein [Chitinophaga dinghuensis]RAJ77274.1 nucleotide-binding universal stress UspA family protein [Chitinophaga dinghuensis]
MNPILVATDFSPAAQNAADYAVDLALALNKEVVLINVYTYPISYNEVPVMVPVEEIEQGIHAELKKWKESLSLKAQGKISIEMEESIGTFYSGLQDVCDRLQPYMVIMGSQGSTAAERLLLGGHTVYTMRHLKWPVMAVPVNAHFTDIRNVGLACDLSKPASIPVERIKALLNDFHAELHILNIEGKHQALHDSLVASFRLINLFGELEPQYHYVKNKHIDEALMEVTVKNDIQLLIVLPQHHHLLDSLAHKSHTRHLTMRCPAPLLALQ